MSRNFVIVCGGPGIYKSCDPAHDKAWSSYVDNILLLAARGNFPKQSDEDVWWFVYKPAYEARWNDDKAKGRSSVKAIQSKGSKSYVHHLQRRADKYGWNLRWITSHSDLWKKLKTFRDKISRVWYFGHASENLWLSLDHNSSCQAIEPDKKAVISTSQIASQSTMKSAFEPGGTSYIAEKASRFYGCNTASFAIKFAKTFSVYTEGAKGKIDFEKAHSTGGKLKTITQGCTWNKYDTKGNKI